MTVATAFAQHYPILPMSGSPHGIVTIMQDEKSRLWLGTKDDVYCFDGVNFYSIRQYGFPEETVTSLAEDNEGGIWIGTRGTLRASSNQNEQASGGGLYRFWGGRVAKIHNGEVFSVVRYGPGIMLASFRIPRSVSDYGDLYRFEEHGSSWTGELLLQKQVFRLSVDTKGSTLFPCPQGWCEIPRKEMTEWPHTHSLKTEVHTLSLPALRVLRDRFGYVWIRAEAIAGYIEPNSPDINRISLLPSEWAGLDSGGNLEESPDGSILLLNNLTIGRPNAFHVARARNGTPSSVHAALSAIDGTIWLANDDGLFCFLYPFRLEYWTGDNGLQSPYSIARVGDKVYAAEGAAGIARLDQQRSGWAQFVAPGPKYGIIVDLLAGPDGTLLATNSRDLAQFDKSGNRLARGGTNYGGMRLVQTSDDQLWLGSDSRLSKAFKVGNRFIFKDEDLPQSDTPDLESDARHVLWACHGKDILFRDGETWKSITAKDGLLDWPCISIAAHPDGDVWLGYMNRPAFGVIRSAASDHRSVRNFFSDEKVGDAQTNFFDVDHKGWLWRGSNTGVYVATPSDAASAEWLHLDKQDGLPALDTNQQAFYPDVDGSIWFGAGNTVTHFTPQDGFASVFPAVTAMVSGFSLNGGQPILAENTPEIPYGASVAAQIGSLQFDRRNELHVRYRLLPGQSQWTLSNKLSINLGKMSWGRHTLQVQAQLASGPWSAVSEQTLDVLLPAWFSWPAFLTLGIAGTGCGFGAVQWRKYQKFKRELMLPDLSSWRNKALSPESGNLIGTVIDGRYEIGPILSIGGFATVLRAHDLHADGQLCAVKLFRYEIGNQAWILHRFEQEVTALEQLSHPNIVRITGHGSLDTGAPYLVMEFIQGRSLRDLLEDGALPSRLIARYLGQITGALATLHQAMIFHRDVKPDNLMIRSAEGDEPHIVLIDFSIAIVQSPDQTFQGISRVAGTPDYMAPEQVIGYADATTDIYSLAKVLMEMLTGVRWADIVPEATLDLSGQVRRYLMQHGSVLSAESIEMIASALLFDPGQRPKFVSAFAEPIIRDLERAG